MHRFLLFFVVAGLIASNRITAQSASPFGQASAAPAKALSAGSSAVDTADAADKKPAASDSMTRALNINSLESGTLLKIISQAFDTNSDSINPENGTFNWKGHSYDIGQFRVFRGRFERYLALPPTKDDKAYGDTLNEITELLSTRNGDGALSGNFGGIHDQHFVLFQKRADGSLIILDNSFNNGNVGASDHDPIVVFH